MGTYTNFLFNKIVKIAIKKYLLKKNYLNISKFKGLTTLQSLAFEINSNSPVEFIVYDIGAHR